MNTPPESDDTTGRPPGGETPEPARSPARDAPPHAPREGGGEDDDEDEDEDEDDDDGVLSPAWREELDARVRRRESGETAVWSQEEVHAHIRTLLS